MINIRILSTKHVKYLYMFSIYILRKTCIYITYIRDKTCKIIYIFHIKHVLNMK